MESFWIWRWVWGLDKLSVLWFPSLRCHLCGLQAKEFFVCSIHAWSGGMLLIYWNANNKNNINDQKIRKDLFSFTCLSITEFEDSRMVGMGISQVSVLSWLLLCLTTQMALKATQMKPQVGGCWAEGPHGPALNKGLSANYTWGFFMYLWQTRIKYNFSLIFHKSL